jgi:uncharacterized hydrophobic protein (TIGR00271 family)
MSVLTVVTRESESLPLVRFGYQLARALETRLVVLCIEKGDGGETATARPGADLPEDIRPTAAGICRELAPSAEPAELAPVAAPGADAEEEGLLADPEVEVRWLATRRPLAAVLREASEAEAELLLAAKHAEPKRQSRASLARKLFTAAPCHTMLLRIGGDADAGRCRRILVPSAGGPHARLALRLGEKLAAAIGGELVALCVVPDEGEAAAEVGRQLLDRALDAAGIGGSRFVQARIELGADPFATIAEVADEGFDLLLMGESDVGTLRRLLFGTVPDRLLAGETGLTVAVVRREWKLLHRIRRRLGRWLDLAIPQMSRGERIALYEKLQSGSEWNFDFLMLIALSTAIAALGLLQSSAAVVIGAMLVAPLMTPILGAGLALVQGNLPLVRTAARAIVLGYLTALLIGFVLGWLFPIPELTPELLARGGPTLLDMGVAFLSGLAAAYCLSRPGLLAALPGVAIAAALVPPIATTGASLALGAPDNARGSALLFATNVVAIILGAAVSFFAGGVRGKSGASGRRHWVRWSFLVLLLGAMALSAPLGSHLLTQLGVGESVPDTLTARLRERLGTETGAELESVVLESDAGVVVVRLVAPSPPSDQQVADLADLVKQELGAEQTVRVTTELAVVVE